MFRSKERPVVSMSGTCNEEGNIGTRLFCGACASHSKRVPKFTWTLDRFELHVTANQGDHIESIVRWFDPCFDTRFHSLFKGHCPLLSNHVTFSENRFLLYTNSKPVNPAYFFYILLYLTLTVSQLWHLGCLLRKTRK